MSGTIRYDRLFSNKCDLSTLIVIGLWYGLSGTEESKNRTSRTLTTYPSYDDSVICSVGSIISTQYSLIRRSQWSRGLRLRSAVIRLLRLWVQIPPGAWVFVCYECCVLSSRGLCDELITRPEESYRLWCVVVYDLETSWMRRPWPTGGCGAKNIQTFINKHKNIRNMWRNRRTVMYRVGARWRFPRYHVLVMYCFHNAWIKPKGLIYLLTYSMEQSPSWEANQ